MRCRGRLILSECAFFAWSVALQFMFWGLPNFACSLRFLQFKQNFCSTCLFATNILRLTGLVDRVFANSPGDWGSILSRVIPKTQKMVIDASLLNTLHYSVRIKEEWSNPGKGVAPSLTSRCSIHWEGRLQVALNNGRPKINITWPKQFKL